MSKPVRPKDAEMRWGSHELSAANRPLVPAGTESREAPVEGETVPGDTVIEGFCALYNTPVYILDLWVEYLAPGAFSESLNDPNQDVLFCFNHDYDHLLGRRSAGTATFTEKPEGLWSSVRLPKTGKGPWVAEAVDRRDLQGQSIMFRVVEEEWDWEPDVPIRTIKKVRLFEGGVVVDPACVDTTIGEARMKAARPAPQSEAPQANPTSDDRGADERIRIEFDLISSLL